MDEISKKIAERKPKTSSRPDKIPLVVNKKLGCSDIARFQKG